MPNQLITSFNSGEWSPKLAARSDLEKYGSACRTLENFIILPYGGVVRRPGFECIADASNSTSRLFGFNFSTTTSFILEFGNTVLWFYKNGAPIMVSPFVSTRYEIATPFSTSELRYLQFCQINDVVYIASRTNPVQKLSRLADDNWTMTDVAWDWPAMRELNITSTTITPSGLTGTVTLNASSSIFKSGHVGGYFEVSHNRDAQEVSLALTANGTSSTIKVKGDWTFNTTGTFAGTVFIERSLDSGGSYQVLRMFEVNADKNISTSGNETVDCLLRIRFTWNSSSGTPGPRAYLNTASNYISGVVKITGFTSGTSVTGTVVQPLGATTATKFWKEGEWSGVRGYPVAVCLHEQRLVLGGTINSPQTVWASKTGDFENFKTGVADDDALAVTLASNQTNKICWIVSQRALCIGTKGDEYALTAGDSNGAITPKNFQVMRQSRYGSAEIQALVVNEVTIFVQRNERKIREFAEEQGYANGRYVSTDLTLLADHITQSGIKQIAFQQQPDSILWVLMNDGTLAGLTYDRQQNVVGWHRHTIQGIFASIATIYGTDGNEELWAIARGAGGESVSENRYVLRMASDYRTELENEANPVYRYLDFYTTTNGVTPAAMSKNVTAARSVAIEGWAGLPISDITNLSVFLDGVYIGDRKFRSTVTVPEAKVTGSTMVLGVKYPSTLEPMTLDPGMLQDGSGSGRKKRVHRATVKVYKSIGGEIKTGTGNYDALVPRGTDLVMDARPATFTGEREVILAQGPSAGATVTIRQDAPYPLVVLGIVAKYDVLGD